jgi:hypothetical protein
MILTLPAPPLSNPRARGLHPARSALMALIRLAVLVGGDFLFTWMTPAEADPVGTGLTFFLITFSVAGAWALVDGWRRPLRTGAVAWLLTAALFAVVSPLADLLTASTPEGGWTGLPDYLALVSPGAGFVFGLVMLPATVGLGLGHLIRRSLRTAPR